MSQYRWWFMDGARGIKIGKYLIALDLPVYYAEREGHAKVFRIGRLAIHKFK